MNANPVETTLYSLAGTPPTRPERRRSERHLSLLRVGAVSIGDRRELCLIRNISAGGIMVRAYSQLKPGERISIELKQGDPVKGVVQWVDDELTGIAFDSTVDILTLLSPAEGATKPRMPRIEIDCAAWIRVDGELHRIRATNISQGGLRAETPARLPLDADVVITLPRMAPIAGVLKWRDGEAYGIGFNKILALTDIVSWLKAPQDRESMTAG